MTTSNNKILDKSDERLNRDKLQWMNSKNMTTRYKMHAGSWFECPPKKLLSLVAAESSSLQGLPS